VVLDPTFALAWASLASTHYLRVLHGTSGPTEAVPAARAALERALALDPDLAEAHVAAGNIAILFDWDWEAAHASLRRGLELAPGSAVVHLEYAWCMWVVGGYDEAIEHSRRALELDPLGRSSMHHVGFSFLAARRFGEAIAAFEKALEVHPNWVWGNTKMGIALAYDNRPAEALAAAARAETLIADGGETPLLRAWLGVLYARAGQEERARADVARLEELARTTEIDPADMATVHVALGNRADALRWLRRGLETHAPMMPFVPALLFFDDLRGDPEYERIVARIGTLRPRA
jgi:serine/threonine-protein kinase